MVIIIVLNTSSSFTQQVAAIFKIGNSKDIPEIPEHLSNEAKSFIRLCLQREPNTRPSASQLLDHPFVRDQATARVANVNITRLSFPQAFDGSRTPVIALELTLHIFGQKCYSLLPKVLICPSISLLYTVACVFIA